MRAPGAVEELARLQANGTQLEPLLRLLLPGIMQTLAAPERTAAAALLRELVSGLDLRPHACTLTEQLLGVIGRAGDAPEPVFLTNLQQTLRFAIGAQQSNDSSRLQAGSEGAALTSRYTQRRRLVLSCQFCL